ncbi:hypothetical protein EJ110_NYTH07222 [Nymphaea thermarum]|nr:hypothetical protein EJ110_NYTH07222 [Nymphaea thermarum]
MLQNSSSPLGGQGEVYIEEEDPKCPQMKMLSRVQSGRPSISEAGPSEISEIHAALIEHEVESSDEKKEVSFSGIKKNDLYLVPGNLMKIQRSVKQTEVSLSIQGSGIRPVFLPFFTKEDVQGWVSKGYKFVHLGQIDVLVKPHFKYELNAPYLVSLLDVRHVDWKQALICQFTGELSKDGLCCVQPNFTLSLQDPHLLQAFVLCVQIKEVNLVAKSVYATITSRCTFNLLQSTLTSFRLDYGINFPLSMNKNILQVGVEISNEGFLQGYPAIGEFLQRQKYKEKKAWQNIFSKYPDKHAHRQSQLQLQHLRALSLPPVLPTVRSFSEETSSPNRDSAVKLMMMTTTKAEQGEAGASGSGYVVSGEWPPKMAYATTTPEEIQKGTPEFRADVSYLLLHSAQSAQKQDDKTRQLNYLIHWSTYAEKHFRRIEEQLQAVQDNLEAVQTLLKGERKESKTQAEAALKVHSQNLSIREISPYSFSNRQKTTMAYKDFYLMPSLQDPKEAGNMKMFQNQRYNRMPDVKKHVISFGSEIPILNIDSCPTVKVSEVIRLWTQHLHMVVSQKRLSPEQAWRILPFTFSGQVANWWKFLPDTERVDIMNNDLSVLGNRIILEFQPNVLAHQSSDWLMFGKRKLKDLSQFEQYAEDYLNKAYRLGAHALQTIGMSFLASIPEALGNLVLEELSHKNMLVEQMNLVLDGKKHYVEKFRDSTSLIILKLLSFKTKNSFAKIYQKPRSSKPAAQH